MLTPFAQVKEIENIFGMILSEQKRTLLSSMLSDWQDGRVKIELGWTLDGLKEIKELSENLIREVNGGKEE